MKKFNLGFVFLSKALQSVNKVSQLLSRLGFVSSVAVDAQGKVDVLFLVGLSSFK